MVSYFKKKDKFQGTTTIEAAASTDSNNNLRNLNNQRPTMRAVRCWRHHFSLVTDTKHTFLHSDHGGNNGRDQLDWHFFPPYYSLSFTLAPLTPSPPLHTTCTKNKNEPSRGEALPALLGQHCQP